MALQFENLGRSRQVRIATPEDLRDVPMLEDALWVATAAPVDAFRMDPVFLGLVDSDGDGRIRSDELRGAIRWLFATLSDTSSIGQPDAELVLSALDPASPDGAAALDAARRILARTAPSGPVPTVLQLDAIRAVRSDEEGKGLSAAGKVLPSAAGADKGLRSFLLHVLETTGGERHPSGEYAVTEATLDRFLAEGAAWLAWHVRAANDASIRALGDDTRAAADATTAIAAKLDQYFLLCDAVALDPEVGNRRWIDTDVDLLDPRSSAAVLERAPLARPRPDGLLALGATVNPAWRDRWEAFVTRALLPLTGPRDVLDRGALAESLAKLGPWLAWQLEKPSTRVGDRGMGVLGQHIGQPDCSTRTRELLARSDAAAVALDGVKLVEKLVLFQRDLLWLANNMVSMPALCDARFKAAFERGTLVMDGRVFEMSLPVNDAARAERFAAMSPMFTMFVRIGDEAPDLDEEIMVPVTAGEREHLVDGMWGVFFDVDKQERHALVRKISVAPISIREAVFSPFRRAGEAIQGMLDKAADVEQTAIAGTLATRGATLTTAASPAALSTPLPAIAPAAAPTPTPAATPTPAVPHPPAGPFGQLPLLIAGAGVAVGAIGAVLVQATNVFMNASGSVAAALVNLPFVSALPTSAQTALSVVSLPLAVVLVVLGIVTVPLLIYLIPVVISAWVRLRRRDLATLLEASGWAINTRLHLDPKLARELTRRPIRENPKR